MKLGTVVIAYCTAAIILHCLFIAYVIVEAELSCIPSGRVQTVSDYDVAHFIAWGVLYFPLLLFCAFYIAVLKMLRSFCCSCWQCCGHNIDSNAATSCKICIDGVFGNPLLFAAGYTLWGVYEWMAFSECEYRLNYGFGLDVVFIALSLLLLCFWYFVRTKHEFKRKQKEHIAQNYNDQLAAANVEMDNAAPRGGKGDLQHDGGRHMLQMEGSPAKAPGPALQARSYSDHSPARAARPQLHGVAAPQYAQSAHGVAPYRPAPSPPGGPQYAASAHGIEPYRPQPNAQPPAALNRVESGASIEISVSLGNDGADMMSSGGHRTRGPSISFPSQFRGHARRVSSGILDILKKIDADCECAICYEDLNKGDEMGQLECGHAFHKQCIVDWLKDHTTCPMCTQEMTK